MPPFSTTWEFIIINRHSQPSLAPWPHPPPAPPDPTALVAEAWEMSFDSIPDPGAPFGRRFVKWYYLNGTSTTSINSNDDMFRYPGAPDGSEGIQPVESLLVEDLPYGGTSQTGKIWPNLPVYGPLTGQIGNNDQWGLGQTAAWMFRTALWNNADSSLKGVTRITTVMRARHKNTWSTVGFVATGNCFRLKLDGSHGYDDPGLSWSYGWNYEGVEFVDDYMASANAWVESPAPNAGVVGSYASGFFGKLNIIIDYETVQEWSARTGIQVLIP